MVMGPFFDDESIISVRIIALAFISKHSVRRFFPLVANDTFEPNTLNTEVSTFWFSRSFIAIFNASLIFFFSEKAVKEQFLRT